MTRWRPIPVLTALALLLIGVPTRVHAEGGDHVRVVLDTSLSMSRPMSGSPANDPGRLAVLATMLLYDLVDPNPRHATAPDSFEVLPFKRDWPRWTDPGKPPPQGTGTPIVATAQDAVDRQAFWERLHGLAYDGAWTYFYPGLRAAIDSLRTARIPDGEHKVIVLVTDGLPEPEVRAREHALLLELSQALIADGIELYVLAFGPVAERERGFFADLYEDRGADLGALFVDPTGRDLLLNMARIFSASFGYQVAAQGGGPRERSVDLDGGITPPKVLLVALARDGRAAPVQRIEPPIASARGQLSAAEVGASYSIVSIEGLGPGPYRLVLDRPGPEVAILRRIEPSLSVLPGRVRVADRDQEMTQAREVIAETPFVLEALAASPTGARGGQAELEILFRQRGPHDPHGGHAWTNDYLSADPGSRRRFGPGVTYDLHMRFPRNRAAPGEPYDAFLEVWARHHGNEVGTPLSGDRAHRLRVYPRIAIDPEPRTALLSPPTLSDGQSGSTRFRLTIDDPGKLAVLGTDSYTLRAELAVAGDDTGMPPALAETRLELDGQALAWEGVNSPWYQGRTLTRDALLGEHELVVTAADRLDDRVADLPVRLVLTLMHAPYKDFEAIAPFETELTLVPAIPLSLEDLSPRTVWALVLTLATLWLGGWLMTRSHPLPRDLGYRIAEWPVDDPRAPREVLRGTGFQRLRLGHSMASVLERPRRPIAPGADEPPLAWLRPEREALFQLQLARGARLELAGQPQREQAAADPARIDVHRCYVIRESGRRWLLQLELESAAPPAERFAPHNV